MVWDNIIPKWGYFAFELYKIKNGFSTESMKIFDNIKPVTYDLRKKQLNILPKVNTTTYGQKSFDSMPVIFGIKSQTVLKMQPTYSVLNLY